MTFALTIIARPTFEGHELTEFNRVPGGDSVQRLRLASQLAEALGYEDPDRLQRSINGTWSDQMIEGEHYVVLTGEDLRPFKDAGLLAKNSSAAMALTEAGQRRVLMLSRMPKALEALDFLVERLAAAKAAPAKPVRGISAMKLRETRMLAERIAKADPQAGREMLLTLGDQLRAEGGLPPLPRAAIVRHDSSADARAALLAIAERAEASVQMFEGHPKTAQWLRPAEAVGVWYPGETPRFHPEKLKRWLKDLGLDYRPLMNIWAAEGWLRTYKEPTGNCTRLGINTSMAGRRVWAVCFTDEAWALRLSGS